MSKVRKSARMLFFGNLLSKAVGFIGSIFLARLLFPEDYAYLLMATILTAFAGMLGNMGFENFYLQEKMNNEAYEKNVLNITFKLRLFTNIILFALQFSLSYFIADYFNKAIVGEILRIFSFEYLIIAVTQINLYILRKKLHYKPEVVANMSRDILGTVVKIIFAFLGFGALSFAFGSIFGSAIRMLILLSYQRFIPDIFDWNKEIFKKIFYFGKHSLFNGISLYLTGYIDKMLLTTSFTASQVGFYSFASSQAQLPSSYLVTPQGSLIMSFTAKHKDSTAFLIKKLSTVSYFIGMLMLPIFSVLFIIAEPAFHFVFGEKWHGSIDLFKLFLFMYFIEAIIYPLAGLLTARGYPQILSKLNFVRLVVTIIGLIITLQISKDVYIYGMVIVGISIIFTVLKGIVGVNMMKESFLNYLFSLKNLVILFLFYVIGIFSLQYFGINKYIYGSIYIIVVSICFFIFFDKKNLLEVTSTVIGEEHRLSKILSMRLKK